MDVTYSGTKCLTTEQAIEFRRRSDEITAQQNAEKCKRMRAIEEHQALKKAEEEL